MMSLNDFAVDTARPASAKLPLSFVVCLRIFAAFSLVASSLVCVYGLVVFVIANLLHLQITGLLVESAILGVPTLYLLVQIFKATINAERDPENN
ncbi:MAG: hypothetical protein AAFN43_05360 [Pseudomonadota bacterium]